ncbi:MAG: S9 family peptidase [Phenylobacterium sp.]|nr:MAG: S9 family peptidase [Phenylobacterium sp.]
MASVRGLLLGSVFTLAGPLLAGPAFTAPLEAYSKLPSVERVAISPDGTRLALEMTDGEKRTIAIQNLAQHKVERVLEAGDAKLRGVMWGGPDHLIVVHSKTTQIAQPGFVTGRAEMQQAFDYNLTTGTAHGLMNGVPSAMNLFFAPAVRTVGGKTYLFVEGVYYPQSRGVDTIYRIDLDRDAAILVEQGDNDTDGFVLDGDGRPIAQTTWNDVQRRWSIRLKLNMGWREVRADQASIDRPELVGLGRDGKSVLVGEKKGDGFIVRELSPGGAWSEPLPLPGAGFGLVFDPARHNLIGYTALVGDEPRTVFFDPKDQQVWNLVEHAYPGQLVELASWTEDRQKIVVHVDSPTEGAGYSLIDLGAHHADWIANDYDKIGPDDIAPRKPVAFKAADGTELTGYLTLPRGKDPKGLPLVVLPHGGPQARDEPGFDWLSQGVASRGYAVLQVNYRGSDGFGEKFIEAGYGQWGRKMQTDLSDGVRYLASQGIIDPKRVCIFGASYGGYAALAGPTLDPGVYRCAVSYAGPADLHAMVTWSQDNAGGVSERYWLRFMGARSPGDAALAEVSPAAHVDRVNVPMLLIHGKDDTVVPLEQSYMMANNMKAAGKPVDLVVLDSTDHWLTRGSTRLAMMQATMAFLEKNNPPN